MILGANVGVLVGIVLLVVELSQNRDMMRAQTRNELSRSVIDVVSMTAGNSQLADIIVRSNHDEELKDFERYMYLSRSEAVFRLWENVHYQYRKGMYDEDEYSKHLETMRVVLENSKGLVTYWCLRRSMYSAAFASVIDVIVQTNSC